MYVIEQRSPFDDHDNYVEYQLDSISPEETQLFIDGLCAATLGAVAVEMVSLNDGLSLISSITQTDNFQLEDANGKILQQVLAELSSNLAVRKNVLMEKAVAGYLGVEQLATEISISDRFGSFVDNHDLQYVTQDGQLADMTFTGMEVIVRDIDTLAEWYGEDSLEYQTARDLGADNFVEQLTRVNDNSFSAVSIARITSPYEHITLGNTQFDGTFQPIVTVLNSDHPFRQATP